MTSFQRGPRRKAQSRKSNCTAHSTRTPAPGRGQLAGPSRQHPPRADDSVRAGQPGLSNPSIHASNPFTCSPALGPSSSPRAAADQVLPRGQFRFVGGFHCHMLADLDLQFKKSSPRQLTGTRPASCIGSALRTTRPRRQREGQKKKKKSKRRKRKHKTKTTKGNRARDEKRQTRHETGNEERRDRTGEKRTRRRRMCFPP